MNDREKLAHIEQWANESLEGIRNDLEKTEHRGDFNRGCAFAMRQVLRLINPPPPATITSEDAAAQAVPMDGPFQFIDE